MTGGRLALAAFLAGGLCAGCATGWSVPEAGLSRLSAAPLPRGRTLERVAVVPGVEARVMTHVFFWVPTRASLPTLEEAVDDAVRQGHGDVLVNASARRVSWYVPPFYGRVGWVVRGDVVRLREQPSPSEPSLATPTPDPWEDGEPTAPPPEAEP